MILLEICEPVVKFSITGIIVILLNVISEVASQQRMRPHGLRPNTQVA